VEATRPRADEKRLLLVSPQRLFRDCLAERLAEADGFTVVGVADDLLQGVAEARRGAAHLLVVDGNGLGERAFDLLAGVSAELGTVVLGARGAVTDLRRYAAAGIHGFVYRDMPLDELVVTLTAVARGERVCGPGSARDLFCRLSRLGRRERQDERLEVLTLTPRQMEVLRLITRGLGNEQIACQLGLSPHTVKNHVHNILARLDARDRAEAVAHAYQRRWLP